jgi:iron complex outermembrane recepter protein
VILTYGYRKDSAKSATLDSASTQQDFSGLFPVLWDTHYGQYGATQSGINRNLGIVVHPMKWLTVFYNHSTTFDVNIGRYDPFGNEIPGAGGKGRDYGVRFDIFGDRVSLRINKYDNSLAPNRAVDQINAFRDIIFNIESRVRALDPSLPTINITDGNKLGFRTAGRPNYFIMSDFHGAGYEIELDANPSPNWSIRVNGAKSNAVESNIGGPWFAWVAQRLPVWQSVSAKNGEVDAQGRPVTWQTARQSPVGDSSLTLEQYYNSALVGQAFAFMKAADGRANNSTRNGRANLITSYRFPSERLKGFKIGGAVRWRAPATIGYGVKSSPAGTPILDLDNAYKGKQELYFDAFAGYRGRMKALHDLTYRIQVNVRNVLNEHDPVPITALSTGRVAQIATVEPRVVRFVFSVEF